ncbi:arabinose efflux permease family protein [Candidatus Nitrososphaera evergladensis SR1]|uniref:Arabinose efflux permease family protein n=1 Tax=Candidatus Nitrososphaera evergladensis SR1 TaxID=1459636 RepID=A0A075MPF7_9ARCH|nr:MFS transporter [Candidatus Nitrososphaera evergladensis]AIF83025.1 arabinose efflux permease family protein [Candidatus Nitrososphaera evergladensis SR1]
MEKEKSQNPDKIPLSAWKTLAILSSIATMVMYVETMLVPSLPHIMREFSLPYSISPWILTTYLIAGAVMTPIASSLANLHGKKKVLMCIMLVYAAGVVVGGITNDFYSFIVARGMQGVGMAMFPLAFSIIREQFPRSRLAIGQGIITSMFASGSILGLLVGAGIAEAFGWRMTFLSIVPITGLLLFVIMRSIREGQVHPQWRQQQQGSAEQAGPKPSLDVYGAIALAIVITSFLLLLTYIRPDAGAGGNSSSSMPTLLAISGVCAASLAAFVLIERKATNPVVDYRLFKNKTLLFGNVMIVVIGFSMFMVFQTIPILAESPKPIGFGANVTEAATIQLPFAVILLIFGPTSGFIVSKMGSIRPAIIGSAVNVLGFVLLATFHSIPWMVSISLAIISTGLSLGSVGIMNIILLSTPQRQMVSSLGNTTLFRIIGSSVGPAVAGVLMQTHLVAADGVSGTFPAPETYTMIFVGAAVMAVLSVVISVLLRKELPVSLRAI